MESKESMAKRADQFLDEQILPLFREDTTADEYTVAIISHGMLLSTLWRRLLLRLPRRSLTIVSEVTAARGEVVLEHLGGWSNTGYLQLSIKKKEEAIGPGDTVPDKEESAAAIETLQTPIPPPIESDAASVAVDVNIGESKSVPISEGRDSNILKDYSTEVLAVDSKQHLTGMKRQRGGIGRSAHDESQKKLDIFFKKRRVD